jgi:hypothetical protein
MGSMYPKRWVLCSDYPKKVSDVRKEVKVVFAIGSPPSQAAYFLFQAKEKN